MPTLYTVAQPPHSKPYGPQSSPYYPPPQQPPHAAQHPSSAHRERPYPQKAHQPPYTPQHPSSSMEKCQQQQYPQRAQQPPYADHYPSSSMEKSQQQQYPQQAQQPPYASQYPASAMEKPQQHRYPRQASLSPVHTQPQPIQTMAVEGGGNRNVKNLHVRPNGRRWSHDLFDCCDEPGICLFSWFCPCVVHSRIKNRVEHLNYKGIPDPEAGGGFFSNTCISHFLLNACCGLGCVYQVYTRSAIRSRYNIEGENCDDWMTALCCTPCELTQESREVQLEEDSFGGQRTA